MTDDERRLLALLAESADGTTDALLVAHDFDFDLMTRMVRERLATATPERTSLPASRSSLHVSESRMWGGGRGPRKPPSSRLERRTRPFPPFALADVPAGAPEEGNKPARKEACMSAIQTLS
jgi:hypothetical protein